MAEAAAGAAPQLASQTLDAALREVVTSLNEARLALEAFVEQADNVQLLQRCRIELAQVQGVLRVMEIHGAALLAEEMHQVCIYLESTSQSPKNQAETLDALMRAIVQLPGYLDRVQAGGRDMALVLLPLLNDLRAVRGSPLLSEGTLLSLNLKSDRQPAPMPAAPGEEAVSVQQWARKLRMAFQAGLIGWIRGDRGEAHFDTLTAVAARFEAIASTQPLFQLWWVIGAVVEALREQGLEGNVSIKRLLGLADREIRRLYEQGEDRYAQHPPVELLNNLLYYVARSSSDGPRVRAVRNSFRLGELLPVDDSVEKERENLSAPSIKLMQTVAAAIREDLAKVKDVLDIYVRRGGAAPDELGTQVELLRKIGDTLGVLGLGEQRARVQAEIAKIEALVAAGEQPAESALIDIAAALIQVEDRLDDELVRMVLPRDARQPGEVLPDVDFVQVQGAVLRECVVNLARVKEYISQNVGGTLDAAGFDNWQELMRGIQAGLAMLGKSRAVDCMGRVTGHLRKVMQQGGSGLSTQALDRLADAIVSIEYYMETLQAGRADPWYMLDNAETALQAVDAEPTRAIPVVSPAGSEKQHTGTMVIGQPGRPLQPLVDVSATQRGIPVVAPVRSWSTVDGGGDPELLALFLEEAREESARIARHLPAWDQDPAQEDALIASRRAFHTLKGSGRVVGAAALAEFAWSVENLLNRLLDKTLSRSPPILMVLREAVTALPQLIDELEGGQPAAVDVVAIATRAHAMAAGKSPPPARVYEPAPATVSAPEPAPEPEPAPAPEPAQVLEPEPQLQLQPEPDPEPTLYEIFARETTGHIATIRGWLARESVLPEPHLLPEPVYRACHTLAGSTKAAGARHGIRLAEPLNHWLRKSYDSSAGVTASDLALIADCMAAMESVSSHLDESTGFFVDHAWLRERIARSDAELDQRVAAAAAPDLRAVPAPAPEPAEAPVEVPVQVPVEVHVPAAVSAEVEEDMPPSVGYDAEVAAIFSDEANELLEECQSSFQGIGLTTPSREEFAALKRPLHTLKGGARMAGVMTMGDLAHELESLIIGIELGTVPPSQQAREALQRSLDQLAQMRDLMSANAPVPAARELLRQVRTLNGSVAAVVEIAPAPEPAYEPAPTFEPVLFFEPPQMLEPEPVFETAAAPGFEPAPEPELAAAPEPESTPDAGADPAPEVTPDWPAGFAFDPPPPEPAFDTFPSNVIELPLPESPPPSQTAWEQVGADAAASPPPVFNPPTLAAPPVPTFHKLMAAAAVPPGREPSPPVERVEMARVDAELLNQLLNQAGEVSIARSRVEQQLGSVEFNLGELSRTVTRLKEQLSKLEIETEAQILHRHETEMNTRADRGDFDPLELDRYSSIQQFSRALAETANDVASIQAMLETLTQEAQNQLIHQGRTVTELQNGLMRTRMVSFQRHVQRMSRIVRQTASDTGKIAELSVEGAAGEMDRQVLERMLPPFEHLLRNAVVHGIESPERRLAAGKPEAGRIHLALRREGAEVLVEVSDDGGGMNIGAIRNKAIALGMIREDQALTDQEAMALILEPGFSTAENLTQAAGRGVGMDVVAVEVKKLGGSLNMETEPGLGSRFMIRLPLTLAVSHALILGVGDEQFALPMPTIEGVVRVPREEVLQHLRSETPSYLYGGHKYRLQQLASFVGLEPGPLPDDAATLPVAMVRAGELSTGVVAEELVGTREIVVKPVGPQIASVRGVAGATIMGDGRIVVILDIGALVRGGWRGREKVVVTRERLDRRIVALVVDDSITVRRVTQRLLERNGMRVLTARDGEDAVNVMAEHVPDVVLLDIEMPRMDGYEVAQHMRNSARLKHVPIIMITSRVGEKHRARAMEIGVDEYLGKPYQESQLLEAIAPLVARGGDQERMNGQ
jgi:chemosensory pili system protein ChpA (sensor histidine kinase/response regulator)